MATKNIFSQMLNQKTATAPGLKAPGVKTQKAPGSGEFAYLAPGNSLYRHPLENHGNDVSQSVWAHIANMKPKGFKHG
jgi:hypothetical protein